MYCKKPLQNVTEETAENLEYPQGSPYGCSACSACMKSLNYHDHILLVLIIAEIWKSVNLYSYYFEQQKYLQKAMTTFGKFYRPLFKNSNMAGHLPRKCRFFLVTKQRENIHYIVIKRNFYG